MTTILLTIHETNEFKVSQVMREMIALGAPRVRVVDCDDHYFALEGCHRLAAAQRLGIAPIFDVLDQHEVIPGDSLDWDTLARGESYIAGELIRECYSCVNGRYDIAPDGTLN